MKIIFSCTYMDVVAIKSPLAASCDVYGVVKKVLLIFEDALWIKMAISDVILVKMV